MELERNKLKHKCVNSHTMLWQPKFPHLIFRLEKICSFHIKPNHFFKDFTNRILANLNFNKKVRTLKERSCTKLLIYTDMGNGTWHLKDKAIELKKPTMLTGSTYSIIRWSTSIHCIIFPSYCVSPLLGELWMKLISLD